MLKSVYLFFKKEPKYFWLLALILSFYALMHLGLHFSGKKLEKPLSPEVVAFQAAEENWGETMDRDGAFREFAARKPVWAALFQMMTLFIFLVLIIGSVVIALFLWMPSLRRKFTNTVDPPVHRGSWSFAMLFKVVLIVMAWGILLSIVLGGIQTLWPKGPSDNYYMILHTFLLDLVCLAALIHFLKAAGSPWQDLGFHLPPNGFFREVRAGLLGYMGVLPLFILVVVGLMIIANLFHYVPPPHPLVNVFIEEEKGAPFLIFSSVLLGAVVGPVFEEIFFRGFCYPIFKNRWGKVWGMVLSAAFFAGIHHTGFVFWPIFVLGIALAYIYEKRGSLVASITLHVTHNTFFLTYFFLVKQIVGTKAL